MNYREQARKEVAKQFKKRYNIEGTITELTQKEYYKLYKNSSFVRKIKELKKISFPSEYIKLIEDKEKIEIGV